MIPSFGIDPFEDDEDAGRGPAFSFVPRAMAHALPEALVVLGLSAFAVSGCAILVETRDPAPLVEPVAKVIEAPPAPSRPSPAPQGERLMVPVKGINPEDLRDNFLDARGKRVHRALDIMARRGTPVLAAGDGRVAKVYRHILGGLCVYQYDAREEHVYYYAHLEAYAPGLAEGAELKRGDTIGYVGTSGNASPTAPHLHFALIKLDAGKKWHKGTAINPYPRLAGDRP